MKKGDNDINKDVVIKSNELPWASLKSVLVSSDTIYVSNKLFRIEYVKKLTVYS